MFTPRLTTIELHTQSIAGSTYQFNYIFPHLHKVWRPLVFVSQENLLSLNNFRLNSLNTVNLPTFTVYEIRQSLQPNRCQL